MVVERVLSGGSREPEPRVPEALALPLPLPMHAPSLAWQRFAFVQTEAR